MRILTILNNDFEELECVGTVALLKRAGIDVTIATFNSNEQKGRYNISLNNLENIYDQDLSDYDALFIPGGPHYKFLDKNNDVKNIIKYFMDSNKYVCAICAAPTILGHLGYLKNKNYTCFTSLNEDFGGTYKDQYVVKDNNLITAKSAAATIDFGFEIIKALLGSKKEEEIKKQIYYEK